MWLSIQVGHVQEFLKCFHCWVTLEVYIYPRICCTSIPKWKIGQFVLMPCEWNEFKRHSCTWEMFIYCLTNMGELIKMVCSYLWKTGDWVLKLLFKSSCIWQQNFMINLSAYLVRVHPQCHTLIFFLFVSIQHQRFLYKIDVLYFS